MKITRSRLLIALLLVSSVAVWLMAWGVERLYRNEADGLTEPSYSLIEDRLYMGGNVPEPPAGTTAVLNLCEQPDAYECDIQVWKPIRDGVPAPSLDWLREQVAFVETQQQAGRTTFVHCFQGASRSGLVVIAYVMQKHHWPRDRALEFVRSKRPQTRPNPAFMELLSAWDKEVKNPT